jgi:hypothetical protein
MSPDDSQLHVAAAHGVVGDIQIINEQVELKTA